MPRRLFESEMRGAGDGISAILKLAECCETSQLATVLRYVKLTSEAMAVVVSEGATIRYSFLSDELQQVRNLNWLQANMPLPIVPTLTFNEDPKNVLHCHQVEHETAMGDWFGGDHTATLRDETIGLGSYGRTLTVLTSDVSAEDDDEDAELEDSWTPRFKR